MALLPLLLAKLNDYSEETCLRPGMALPYVLLADEFLVGWKRLGIVEAQVCSVAYAATVAVGSPYLEVLGALRGFLEILASGGF